MVLGAVSLAVALAAQAAMAAEITDPNEGGPFDIRSVHATRVGQVLEVSVSTYQTWRSVLVASSPPPLVLGELYKNRIQIIFDTNSDGVPDYVGVIVRTKHRGLRMIVEGPHSNIQAIKATRPDHYTVLVKLPDGSVANPTHKYQLAAKSVFFGGPPDHPKVVDRAPDSGWIAIPHA